MIPQKSNKEINNYKHWPLARAVIGQQQVQGLDYAYTLEGWLKGVNSTSLQPANDMGNDGLAGSANQFVAKDAYGFNLNYFTREYAAINSGVSPFPGHSVYMSSTEYKPLFNGNISSMAVNIAKLDSPMLYNYQYDQLNRIVSMDAYNGLNPTGNNWSGLTKISDYKERVAYDANGNILKYYRNGSTPLGMDSLTYKYNRDVSGQLMNNKLMSVKDSVPSGNYPNDIDNQSNNNYAYDSIGNLIKDNAGGISTITWTVYGKISSIAKTDGSTIAYTYDASGNRISKTVTPASGPATITWYVRDASGNVMAVYTATGTDSLYQSEQHLYGSSRLGIYNRNINADAALPSGISASLIGHYFASDFTRGSKLFELTNHLGNVLVTVSDKKIGHNGGSSGTIDYYTPDVVAANDYYPFGSLMPGRQYSMANTNYRYGFNGKENDNEVKGEGNQQDYGMRIYDPRLGRFLSVDPLTKNFPFYSPYHFAGNNPIENVDLGGGEPLDFKNHWRYHTIFNPKSGSSNGMSISVDDPKLGYVTVEGVYDNWSKQAWFIHADNQGNYYYLKNISGDNQTLSYTADPKHKLVGGQFEKFETQDATQARLSSALADDIEIFFAGGITSIAAAPVVVEGAALLPTFGEATLATRGTSALIDYGAQVTGNYIGGRRGADAWINNINITSIGLSFANPVNGIKSLAFNSVTSSAFSVTVANGYDGLGGGKSLETFGQESVVSFIVGSLTLGTVGKVSQLRGRLEHVQNLLGNDNSLAHTLQSTITKTQTIGNTIGGVSGAAGNAIDQDKKGK